MNDIILTDNDTIDDFIAASGLRFLHLPAKGPKMGGKGGCTVAWRPHRKFPWHDTPEARKRPVRFVEVAVAFCHPTDDYNKRIGRRMSALIFMGLEEGMVLRVPAGMHVNEFLRRTFFWSSQPERKAGFEQHVQEALW